MSLLEVSGLTIRYGGEAVVDDLSFELDQGESLGLVGESGSGKTQTALALMGLNHPAAEVSGDIRLDGQPIAGLAEAELNRVRATRMSMVFQDPTQSMNPYVRVGDQLSRILLEHGLADPVVARERVGAMLDRVGLPDPGRQYYAYPHELSGGMQQRVGLVRAFALGAPYLLMDEPFAALDEITRADMRHLLAELCEPIGAGVVFVTHSLAEAVYLSDRVVVLSARPGRVVGAVDVNLPRPRRPEVEDDPAFFALESEVRSLLLTGAGR